MLFSLMPDIDIPTSRIDRPLFWLSVLLRGYRENGQRQPNGKLSSGDLGRGYGETALCQGRRFAGLSESNRDPGRCGGAVLVEAGGCRGGVELFGGRRESGNSEGVGLDVLSDGFGVKCWGFLSILVQLKGQCTKPQRVRKPAFRPLPLNNIKRKCHPLVC